MAAKKTKRTRAKKARAKKTARKKTARKKAARKKAAPRAAGTRARKRATGLRRRVVGLARSFSVGDRVMLLRQVGETEAGSEGKVLRINTTGSLVVNIDTTPACEDDGFLLPPLSPDHFTLQTQC